MKLILNDKLYDVLKWICIIVLPAVATFIGALGVIWNWNIPTQQIVETIGAVEVFLGALLGISCYQYNKENKNNG